MGGKPKILPALNTVCRSSLLRSKFSIFKDGSQDLLLRTGLVFVNKLLQKHQLKDQIKIIASGKAIDAFDIVKYLALGADAIGMARSFMLSLGSIQAR